MAVVAIRIMEQPLTLHSRYPRCSEEVIIAISREEELVKAIGNALAKVTAKDALNWFISCGYRFC